MPRDNRPDFLCAACFTYHEPPQCLHDSTLPCFDCGNPRGYRWTGDDGKPPAPMRTCFKCWWVQQGNPPFPPMGNGISGAADASDVIS